MRLGALLPFALWLGLACNCEGDTFVVGTSALVADPEVIDFGRVFIGAERSAELQLIVEGTVSVSFGGAFDGGDPRGFRASPAGGRIIAGGSATMRVEFRPQVPGQRQTTILVRHDAADTSQPLRIELRGLAVAPPDCEDGNGCSLDTFDPDRGQCLHEFQAVACDDFNACTQSDTCVQGLCLGQSVGCDDNNACTDDVCDPQQGCRNIFTQSCDDGNECTRDSCDNTGCKHEDLDDGTPCDDLEQCTVGDICLLGSCQGVQIENGVVCDDLDPCSHAEQCIDGRCYDPGYRRAEPGELKFATRVGTLAPGASNNPIVDRDSSVMVGTVQGVASVDQCGDLLWRNDDLGLPNFGAAVSLPGIISVPFGSKLSDLDSTTGEVIRDLEFRGIFDAPVKTASTATVTVQIVDMAVRRSGGLVVSLWRQISDPASVDGWIAEVDATHTIATLFRPLGRRRAIRLAVDADEAVVAVLSDGAVEDPTSNHQVVRFGLGGLPETTWSSNSYPATHTDLALGKAGEVLWSAGLIALSRTGSSAPYLNPPQDPLDLQAGAPILDRRRVFSIVRRGAEASVLIAQTATTGASLFEVELPAPALQVTPVVDADGNVFCALQDGRVVGYDRDGRLLLQLYLPLDALVSEPLALTLTPKRVVVIITQQTVFGVQSVSTLSTSSWPRHRRDNLSTGHR